LDQGRKFAPTITALKEKLNAIKLQNWTFKERKISDFNLEQAEISARESYKKSPRTLLTI
jgi:glutamyl-tRNA reductase